MDEKKQERFSSRKFLFTVGIFVTGSIFRIFDFLASAEWMELTKWILLVYICGNVVGKYLPKIIKK